MKALMVTVLVAALAHPAHSESLLDKSKRDETVTVPTGDPDMDAAMRTARSRVHEFLALVQAPKPSTKNFSVKLRIPYEDGNEYFWLRILEIKNGQIIGQVRNTPRHVKTVKFGDKISFAEKDILDWMYLDGENMKGNFTACALLKRETKANAEAFKRQYRLECDG